MNILKTVVLILVAIYLFSLISSPHRSEKSYDDLWNDNISLSGAYLECVDNTEVFQELIKELTLEADKCFEVDS